ncbi:hypothetical protein [uncultured virus]|uniref:Uncharacterized protein n=1 Tax=uncultured virus TaxID=340016 RepID=A0A218MMC6_9VIRU|nr:hypothetical protein [uncultured virus]
MSYLKSKDGSIEASIKEMQKNLKDNAYQQMFKKELEKTGKGIGSMSDMEKKDFFNKLDKMYKGKDEDLDSKDEPSVKDVANQLKKAVKAHGQQAKDLEKAIKTEEESFDIEKLKEDVNTLWSTAGDSMEEMKKNAKYMKAQDVAPDNDSDAESEKEKSGKTLIGSKKTKIVTEPKVDYQK